MDKTYVGHAQSSQIGGTYYGPQTTGQLTIAAAGQPKERTSLEALEHDLNNGLDQFWRAVERLTAVNRRLFGPMPAESSSNTAQPLPESIVGRLGDKSSALLSCSHILHEEISRLERL